MNGILVLTDGLFHFRGGRFVGDGHPCYVIAEIGINHNGDIDLARRLISVAVAAGVRAMTPLAKTV